MRQNAKGQKIADGLVFAGPGIGCNSSWQIGVVKALLSDRLAHLRGTDDAATWRPDIFTGGVFGALNAAVMAQNADSDLRLAVEHLERVWKDDMAGSALGDNGVFRLRGNPIPFLNPRSLSKNLLRPFTALFQDAAVVSENWAVRLANLLRSANPIKEAMMSFDAGVFFDTEPYRQTLEKHLDFARLRGGPAELRVVTTDWISGQPSVYSQHDLNDTQGLSIFMASAALTLIFPLIEISGRPHAGGGDVTRTPIEPALAAAPEDADELHLHVMRGNPPIQDIPLAKPTGSLAQFDRNFTLQLAYISDRQCLEPGEINRLLEQMARVTEVIQALQSAQAPTPQIEAQIEQLARLREEITARYKPLNVHFYRPSRYQGATLEALNFDRGRISGFIDLGYRDALNHDCGREGCCLL